MRAVPGGHAQRQSLRPVLYPVSARLAVPLAGAVPGPGVRRTCRRTSLEDRLEIRRIHRRVAVAAPPFRSRFAGRGATTVSADGAGEVVLQDTEEELFRLVHPSFVHDGRVSSQALRPTPKDQNLLRSTGGR